MGKEKEVELYSSDMSEFPLPGKSEDTISGTLHERDLIRPEKETGPEPLDSLEMDGSMETNEPDEVEIDMPVMENGDQLEESQTENEMEISLEYDEEQDTDYITESDAAEDLPDEPDNPMVDDLAPDESDYSDDAPLVQNSTIADGTVDNAALKENDAQGETQPGSNDAGRKGRPENDPRTDLPEENKINAFDGLDNDDLADVAAQQKQPKSREKLRDIEQIKDHSEETAAETGKNHDALAGNIPLKELPETAAGTTQTPPSLSGYSSIHKTLSGALIALIIAGFVLYYNPSWIGFEKARKPTTPEPVKNIENVAPAALPATAPPVPNEHAQCLSKIEEAVRLRNLLLEKNEEVYDLGLHYRNGIAELEEDTYQDIKRAGLTSYEAAMKNKRIELNLRMIQRRRAYIKGLEKPAFWLNSGSEELLYLVRKARLDMHMTEIAGGIDLKKHMRHLDAVIQKYSPSVEKLAVDPPPSDVQSLEKIWQQVSRMEQTGGNTEKNAQLALNPKDARIVNQICSGNFDRVAELTNISSRAAGCLARMQGSDLFLNGLTTLSPQAAQQLFKWQGDWICLNGLKNLSPAAAQYVFSWQGNWISLNSLSDFPPELAKHLLKWEGQQLELMGFQYKPDTATQNTLKYLVLWETTGGKVFVTDKIRRKMQSLMQSR